MSIALWLPLLTTLIATFAGAIVYSVQRAADRKNSLIAKRREAYEAFWHAHLYTHSKEHLEQLNYVRLTLALVASDDVLRRAADFEEYVVSTNPPGPVRDNRKLKQLAAALVGAMRRDVFERTNLSDGELERNLPIQ